MKIKSNKRFIVELNFIRLIFIDLVYIRRFLLFGLFWSYRLRVTDHVFHSFTDNPYSWHITVLTAIRFCVTIVLYSSRNIYIHISTSTGTKCIKMWSELVWKKSQGYKIVKLKKKSMLSVLPIVSVHKFKINYTKWRWMQWNLRSRGTINQNQI